MLLSLASTLIVTWFVPCVIALSLPAITGSHTGLMVMVNEHETEVSLPPLAVPPLSCAFTLTFATPLALAAGV